MEALLNVVLVIVLSASYGQSSFAQTAPLRKSPAQGFCPKKIALNKYTRRNDTNFKIGEDLRRLIQFSSTMASDDFDRRMRSSSLCHVAYKIQKER